MFRQLKVPVLGMIENMSFFDVVAYLEDRGGPEAHKLIDAKSFFDTPGDERVYIFGRGGARRKAEQMGVPFLGEVPLNIFLRETGDEGKMEHALLPARPPGPTCWASSNSSPPRSASRTSRRPRCPSWKSSARSIALSCPNPSPLRTAHPRRSARRASLRSARRFPGPGSR